MRPANMTSKAQSGTTLYAEDGYRSYLMIIASAGGITVALADGASWPIDEGDGWEPMICPTSAITIVGECVVVTTSVQP